MKKIETIWHYILFKALNDKEFRFTQKGIALHFNYSLSTVNYAVEIPAQIGAIRKETKFFVLENFFKLLYFWASQRNLFKDILYSAAYDGSIKEIEGLIPPESIFACYSAASRILKEPSADYSKVYFYINKNHIAKTKERFPSLKKLPHNIFAIKGPDIMKEYGSITTLPQTFADVWNLKDWYGQDFIKSLEDKINEKLSA